MCMTEQSELSYKAMDETAEWGVTHLRQPRRDNVIPMPTKPVHELHAHVTPEAPQSMTFREAVICVACSIGLFALILLVAASHS